MTFKEFLENQAAIMQGISDAGGRSRLNKRQELERNAMRAKRTGYGTIRYYSRPGQKRPANHRLQIQNAPGARR